MPCAWLPVFFCSSGTLESCWRIISAVPISGATTIKCLVPREPLLIINVGSTVTPSIKAGIRSVMTIKDLVRTRSRYSRRAISMMLCIRFSDYLDEDLFQRGLHQFKLVDSRMVGHHAQKLLRIGPRGQPHLDVIAVVVE